MSVARVLCLVVAVGFCAGSAASTPAYQQPEVQRAVIVSGEHARASRLRPVPVSLPFGPGANGNQMVEYLLTHVRSFGASFVSDVEIQLNGSAGACTTRVLPRAELAALPPQAPMPWSTRTVSERVFRCRLVTEPVPRSARAPRARTAPAASAW
jgi:hypothetical protein